MTLLGSATSAAAQQIGPIQAAGLRAATDMALAATAQPPPDEGWWRVEALERGAEVRIGLRSGQVVARTVEYATIDAIVVSRGADPTQTTFAKLDIVAVTRPDAYRTGSGGAAAFLLGLVGAIAGGVAVRTMADCHTDMGCVPAAFGAVAAGATLGAIVGYRTFTHPVDQTIYRAP